jgi:hypothetical protein
MHDTRSDSTSPAPFGRGAPRPTIKGTPDTDEGMSEYNYPPTLGGGATRFPPISSQVRDFLSLVF